MVIEASVRQRGSLGLPTLRAHNLSQELSGGLLQDLLALSMLTAALRDRLYSNDEFGPRIAELLERLDSSLGNDVERIRALIAELSAV